MLIRPIIENEMGRAYSTQMETEINQVWLRETERSRFRKLKGRWDGDVTESMVRAYFRVRALVTAPLNLWCP